MSVVTRLVDVTTTVRLEFDDALLPDDEWRAQFYNIRTLDELAAHWAYNYVVNAVESIDRLDGWADQPRDAVRFEVLGGDTEVSQP